MTDEQVNKFVDGFMPAYEMYTDGLMRGELFGERRGRQILRIDYDQNRKIVGVQKGIFEGGANWNNL